MHTRRHQNVPIHRRRSMYTTSAAPLSPMRVQNPALTTPTLGNNSHRLKSVRMSRKDPTIYSIPDLRDSSYHDDLWFSGDEMDATKTEANQLAEALEALQQTDSSEDWRGLESRGPVGHWKAYKARLNCQNAVLDAAEARHSSPALVAAAARTISTTSVEAAIQRAVGDATMAADYCQDAVVVTTTSLSPRKRRTTTRSPKMNTTRTQWTWVPVPNTHTVQSKTMMSSSGTTKSTLSNKKSTTKTPSTPTSPPKRHAPTTPRRLSLAVTAPYSRA